jgi:hypothetical protein
MLSWGAKPQSDVIATAPAYGRGHTVTDHLGGCCMKQAILMAVAALLAVALTLRAFSQQATPEPLPEVEAAQGITDVVTPTDGLTPTQTITPTGTVTPTATITPTGITTTEILTPVQITTTGPPTTVPPISPTVVMTTEAVTTTVIVTTTTAVTEQQVITTPAPAAEPLVITGAVPPAYLAVNLAGGFPLDPFLVSVNGGGPFSVEGLGPDCRGFVNHAPTLSLNWSGSTDSVEVFFYSDHDPVLVVQLPNGQILCNDDANEALLDPRIRIDAPAPGPYHIWVGSYAAAQLIPGLLVITANPALNLGTFRLDELVKRAPIPEEVIKPAEIRTTQLPTVTAGGTLASVAPLQPGAPPLTMPVTVTGTVPAFDLPIEGTVCTGYLNDHIDYSFTWAGATSNLRIYFEGSGDASLLVIGPGNSVYCNDDAAAGQNLNPMIDILSPQEGAYLVLVGRLSLETPLSGVLTVVESNSVFPGVMPPGQ